MAEVRKFGQYKSKTFDTKLKAHENSRIIGHPKNLDEGKSLKGGGSHQKKFGMDKFEDLLEMSDADVFSINRDSIVYDVVK